jgi:predicted transcriptional regulator
MLFSYTFYVRMKNITFSADEDLIERARSVARAQHTTLNAAFRQWLAQFTASSGDTQSFDAVMTRMRHVDAGQHFGRDEMNGR